MTRALYTEGVQAHWGETTVGEHGEPLLDGLPFEPGQPVEMLVVSKTAGPATAGSEGFATAAISCSLENSHRLTFDIQLVMPGRGPFFVSST